MQAIAETLFDAVYLLSVITLGIIMIVKSEKNKEYPLFGARYSVLPISASAIRFILFRVPLRFALQDLKILQPPSA